MGPMTGRAVGFCAGSNVPGYMVPGVGRGFGMGFGRGRGFGGRGRGMGFARGGWGVPFVGNMPAAPVSTQAQELDYLKNQAEYLQNALEDIKTRMGELDSGKDA